MKFEAKRLTSKTSNTAALLIRAAAWVLPSVLSQQHGLATGIVTAAALGAVDGWSRLWVARTTSSLAAEPAGLRIGSGTLAAVIPWSDVCAVQTWSRINRVAYVVVHYRRDGTMAVASCWDQHADAELERFVQASARGVLDATSKSMLITVAGLGERFLLKRMLGRFGLDVAVAVLVGFVLGIPGRALFLGIAMGVLSSLLECIRYHRRATSFQLKDGLWWRMGSPEPLRSIPQSLRPWATSLRVVASARS